MSRFGWAPSAGPADRGQATVETALLLPALVMAMLAVIQIGLVVHARVMVTHAAREAVRAAAVGESPTQVQNVAVASGGLAPQRLSVSSVEADGRVTVTVRYEAPTNVALIGALIDDVELTAEATMRRED